MHGIMEPEWTQVISEEEHALKIEKVVPHEDEQVFSEKEKICVVDEEENDQVISEELLSEKWKHMHRRKFEDLVDHLVIECSKVFNKGGLLCYIDFTDLAEKDYISCMSLHICNAVYKRLDAPLHCIIFQHMFGARLDVNKLLDVQIDECDRVMQINVDNFQAILNEIQIVCETKQKLQLIMDLFNQYLSTRNDTTLKLAKIIIERIKAINKDVPEHVKLTKEEKIAWTLTNMVWAPSKKFLEDYIKNDGISE